MAKGDELQERLIQFAIRVIKLCSLMPKNLACRHVSSQLLRSGTAPAPNYAEARAAESEKDFIHKLKIALKELHETEIWLKMTVGSDLLKETQVSETLAECSELCRILSASIKTVLTRQRSIRQNDKPSSAN